jgi:alpha-tubulin suppressor-like RCC1 family protein
VPGIEGATVVAAGSTFSCAVLKDATVTCWGSYDGQRGQTDPALALTAVADVHDANSLAAGRDFVCALVANGAVNCWGSNTVGQLGNGQSGGVGGPAVVQSVSSAQAIAATTDAACALLDSGRVVCWGGNFNQQLGDPKSSTSSSIPVPVTLPDAAGIWGGCQSESGGQDSGTFCALSRDDNVYCWGGDGTLGLLGPTATVLPANGPALVLSADYQISSVAVGNEFACALTKQKDVDCWGWNYYGQLGQGTRDDGTPTASKVFGLTASAIAVAAGDTHACALLANGAIQCWGRNVRGQLGSGGTEDAVAQPVAVR